MIELKMCVQAVPSCFLKFTQENKVEFSSALVILHAFLSALFYASQLTFYTVFVTVKSLFSKAYGTAEYDDKM